MTYRRRKNPMHTVHETRTVWDKEFIFMEQRGDDRLIDCEDTSLSTWDEDEWEYYSPCSLKADR